MIEMCLVLLFIPIILNLSLAILSLIAQNTDDSLSQFDVFKLQYRLLYIRMGGISVSEDALMYSMDHDTFTIKQQSNRLVKTPGYEILLFDVLDIYYKDGCLTVIHQEGDFCLEP